MSPLFPKRRFTLVYLTTHAPSCRQCSAPLTNAMLRHAMGHGTAAFTAAAINPVASLAYVVSRLESHVLIISFMLLTCEM